MESFCGFPAEMTEFMWELRFNNNKEWFDLNRKRYEEYMKKPMDVFAKEMCEVLKIALGQEVYYKISRINRDIRFSKNKAPYRDNKWVVFKLREGRWQDMPCMYFDISPEGWDVGVGFYSAKSDFMAAFRKKVDAETRRFEKIVKNLKKHPEFVLYGELYKKNPGKEHSAVVMDWYKRKNAGATMHQDISEAVYTREIFEIVKEKLVLLGDIEKFLNEVSA